MILGKKINHQKAFSLLELAVVLTTISFFIFLIDFNGIKNKIQSAGAASLTKNSPVNNISGLITWYETTSSSSFLPSEMKDGSAISTWYSLSPFRITATQTTADKKPIYKTNVINGLPALRFDGTNDILTSTTNIDSSLTGNPNFTVFIVGSMNGTGGTGWGSFVSWGATTAGNAFLIGQYTTNLNSINAGFWSSNTEYGSVGGVVKFNKIAINEFLRDSNGGNNNSITGNTFYYNGGSPVAAVPQAQIAVSITSTPLTIGGAGGLYLNADIGEVIIFNKSLSDIDRKEVEKYLGKKWGITVS